MATKSESVKNTLKVTSFILRLLLNIIFYVLVAILIIYFSKAAYTFAYQLYGPVALDKSPGREITVHINDGEATMDVASKLDRDRAIINKYSFYLKAKLQNKVIMPGTYIIKSSMTYAEILNIITDPSAAIEQKGKSKDNQSTVKDQTALPDTDQKSEQNNK